MKKTLCIAFSALSILLASCSSEDSMTSESFFNLNVGSKWVYNRYDWSLDNPDVVTLAATDSVEVVEDIVLNGLAFSKVQHKLTYGDNVAISYAYLRVNPAGHLVGFSQFTPLPDESDIVEDNLWVFHPGEDLAFQNTTLHNWGTTTGLAMGQSELTVEGNNYNIWRYAIDATPAGQSESTITVFYDYEAQTGMVRAQDGVISGGNWRSEYRLISYDLN